MLEFVVVLAEVENDAEVSVYARGGRRLLQPFAHSREKLIALEVRADHCEQPVREQRFAKSDRFVAHVLDDPDNIQEHLWFESAVYDK